MFLNASAHQGCIYVIKNTVKVVKYYYNLKEQFSIVISFKMYFIPVSES